MRRLRVRGLHLDDVALDAEAPAPEQRVVAHVLDVDQLAQHRVPVLLLADLDEDDPLPVLLGRAEAVDAGDRRDDDHVPAREQVRGRGVAEPVDLVVPRAVLLDVEVGLRDVRLRLVVVVVGDEVLDRVVREELAELVAELRGERLVVGDHEGGPADALDRPGHRRRLAGAGGADERLVALAPEQPVPEDLDRFRLVAGRLVGAGCFQLGQGLNRVLPCPLTQGAGALATGATRSKASPAETRSSLRSPAWVRAPRCAPPSP